MPWDSAEEVAFECEPGTLTQGKLEAIKEIGVTRLSLGVENLNDEILAENGRAHLSKEVYRVTPMDYRPRIRSGQHRSHRGNGRRNVGQLAGHRRENHRSEPRQHHCVSDGVAVQHRLLKRYFWRQRSICSGLENEARMAPLCV